MKSGAIDTDRVKIEGRQSIYRRKMSKNSPIVNGADESLNYDAEDERQVNLAAAYHDHISCTKSADPCKSDRETRASLPCETDHIYANCSETRNKANNVNTFKGPSNLKDLVRDNKRLRRMVFVHVHVIKYMQRQVASKDEQIKNLMQETETLRARLERRERRMCLLQKRYRKSDDESVDNISEVESATSEANVPLPVAHTSTEHNVTTSVNLVTRYFGRRSKTVPSRALKRRYLGPPKSFPTKKFSQKLTSSASETHGDESSSKQEVLSATSATTTRVKALGVSVKKCSKKKSVKPKRIVRKNDFLTTDKAYFLPDTQSSSNSVSFETIIDVPSWKFKPVSSFYQMEGTENINDPVFHRRHLRCEQDERRRKRWDIQRLREQKASEKLKYKQSREVGKDSDDHVQTKSLSFYPDPRHIEYIEVTDHLPVLAFGHLIPLFQPSEFSLSWKCEEDQCMESTESPANKTKKSRLSAVEPKIT